MLVLKDGRYGIFYGCIMYRETGCPGAHNCNKQDAKPFGVPGDKKTRQARKLAHEWIERLANTACVLDEEDDGEAYGRRRVTQVYAMLAKALNLPPEHCHMGMFDLKTCEKVILHIRNHLGDLTRFEHLDRDIV